MQEKFDISDPLIILKLCAAATDSDSNSLPSNEVYQTAIAYIEKHIDVILEKSNDLSPLPFVAVKDIVNAENVSVPEICLLNFLCKWTTTEKHVLSYSEIEDLFRCIRYGTFLVWSDIQQFCHRKGQKPVLLFYSRKKMTWETKGNAASGVCTVYTGHDIANFSIEWSSKGHTSNNPKIKLTIENSQQQRHVHALDIPVIHSPVMFSWMETTKCQIRLAPDDIKVDLLSGSPTLGGRNSQPMAPRIIDVRNQHPLVISLT